MTTAYLDVNHIYVEQKIYLSITVIQYIFRMKEHFVKLVILKAHNHVCHSGVDLL